MLVSRREGGGLGIGVVRVVGSLGIGVVHVVDSLDFGLAVGLDGVDSPEFGFVGEADSPLAVGEHLDRLGTGCACRPDRLGCCSPW